MYRKVMLSSFHNSKVEYCTTSGSGDIEENAGAIFFYSDFIFDIVITVNNLFTNLHGRNFFALSDLG